MSIIVNNSVKDWLANSVGAKINSPEQRFIQGATALFTQPLFDYYNSSADSETRTISVSRTIGKIIAGTAVGVAVRYSTIFAAKRFSHYKLTKDIKGIVKMVEPKNPKRDIFMPKIEFNDSTKPDITEKDFDTLYNNFIKAMGTILGTFAMLFSNFFIDAPCTKIITKEVKPFVKKLVEIGDKKNDKNS